VALRPLKRKSIVGAGRFEEEDAPMGIHFVEVYKSLFLFRALRREGERERQRDRERERERVSFTCSAIEVHYGLPKMQFHRSLRFALDTKSFTFTLPPKP